MAAFYQSATGDQLAVREREHNTEAHNQMR
jgi:hypothetical protein